MPIFSEDFTPLGLILSALLGVCVDLIGNYYQKRWYEKQQVPIDMLNGVRSMRIALEEFKMRLVNLKDN